MINFDHIELAKIPEFKGGTGITGMHKFETDDVKIMKMILHPGDSIGEHTHETNCEIIYVLQGEAACTLDGVEENILPGNVNYCPKGHRHSMACKGEEDLVVFAVVAEQ